MSNIENHGSLVSNECYIARVEGGLQPAQPTGSKKKIEIKSTNGVNTSTLSMNVSGVNITLPSNDGSNSLISENRSGTNTLNIPSGPLNDTASISIGAGSATANQGTGCVAIGGSTGFANQGNNSTSCGAAAGFTAQGINTVSLGINCGNTSQGAGSVAIGNNTGSSSQGIDCVAIGRQSGRFNQGAGSISIGFAGNLDQAINSVAIGHAAGLTNQGANCTAVGSQAGAGTGIEATTIGVQAAANETQNGVTVIGYRAGVGTGGAVPVIDAGENSTCIGYTCKHQGTYGISLGYESAGVVPFPTDNNSFYIGVKGLEGLNDQSCIQLESTTGSDFKLLCLNAINGDGEIKFINPSTSTIPSQPLSANVKQLTFDTATGQLGYDP